MKELENNNRMLIVINDENGDTLSSETFTVGNLITFLESLDRDMPVDGYIDAHVLDGEVLSITLGDQKFWDFRYRGRLAQ